jgi:hypothetical protein
MNGTFDFRFLLSFCVISLLSLFMLPGSIAALPELPAPELSASGDFLVIDCLVDWIEIPPGSTGEVECIGINTTPHSVGHKVMTGGNETSGYINIVTKPGEFPETHYNVENLFSVAFEVSLDTPPNTYLAEIFMAGYDTNRATWPFSLFVKWPEVKDAEITPWEVSLYPGGQQQFEIEVYDSQGNVISKIPVTWDAEKGEIDENGLYTAPKYACEDQISAMPVDSVEQPFTANVFVIPEIAHFEILPPEVNLKEGEQQQFKIKATDAQGNLITLPPGTVEWKADLGSIDENGLYEAPFGPLLADPVSAFYVDIETGEPVGPEIGATATVNVVPWVVSASIFPPELTLFPGQKQQFSVKAVDANGNDVPPGVADWSALVGLIDETGFYTAPDEIGQDEVSAALLEGEFNPKATVYVKPNINNIKVLPSSTTVKEGQTQQFEAAAFDPDGLVVPFEPLWTATGGKIDPGGLYTAVEKGSQTVTVSAEGSDVTASAAVTVVDLIPWWAWALLILACFGPVGFLIWILFYGRGKRIPCWFWVLLGLCGLVIVWFLLWYFLGWW